MSLLSQQLIEYLNRPEKDRDAAAATSYVNALLIRGTTNDTEALLDYFLSGPVSNKTTDLLPVFEKRGDARHARSIYETHITDQPGTIEEYPELLETMGIMQYEPIKPLLIEYAFDSEREDYYLKKHAALGLLYFDCKDIRPKIRKEIEKTLGKNLFPEFVPALICKLQERADLLKKLWESGRQYSSTDCNAGIILGFSLCGKEGSSYFNKVLYDDQWEADSTATSTAYYTYRGTINQKLSLADFLHELVTTEDIRKQKQGLHVLLSLLYIRVNDYFYDCPDSISDLYHKLFHCQTPMDLTELAGQYQSEEMAYQLHDLMELKMTEEAISNSITAQNETP